MANPAVPYTPYPTVDATGGGGTPFSVRASPQDFGSQVGEATKKAGDDAFEIGQKQQGMINETTMTNADTQMAVKAGQLNAEYKSLSGLAAHAAFPKYQQDLEALRQETRATLPPAAQRGFDMLSMRTIANHIIDGSTYAASQLKEANRDAYSSSTSEHIQQILQPSVAGNDDQFQYNLDTIKFNTAAQLDADHPGLEHDAETGEVKFNENTPEGKTLKAEYERNLDTNTSQAYVNRYDTLAKQGVTSAYDKYQSERDKIPRPAQVALDSYFAPKLFDAHKQTVTKGTIADAQRDHYDMLTNPSLMNKDYSSLDTKLSPEQESKFQEWKAKYAPKDSGRDYDLRGAYLKGYTPSPENGHFPDEFKKPNHPTFSNQSKFAKDYPELAGSWADDNKTYIPPNAASKSIDTIMKNELHADGVVRVHSDGDGKAIGGINSEAFPAQFLEAKTILESKGQDAAKDYIKNFYQTEIIEKNGIDKLPANVQDIVADGVMNHRAGFQKDLIQAAKDGASPQQLIDMRRNEYQRLANSDPAKYGQYLTAWNNRLDNFQVSTEGKKTYATNENGGPMTLADYYRTHSQDVLAKGEAYADRQMPGDLAFKRAVRQTLQNQMSQTISNESAQHQMDNRNVMRAISGELTKGVPPQTEDELRAIPGMSSLLDDVAARDPKFSESIPTLVAKAARRNDVTNSPNGYGTVLRSLEPNNFDEPNRIASQDHLHKLLAISDETGINMKDYNDAKAAIELDPTLKEFLSKHMTEIANANGNIDGMGSQRAMKWYNQTMAAWKQNEVAGDKKLTPTEFIAKMGDTQGPPMPAPPSRMQQISNWAAKMVTEKEKAPPVLTDKAQFDALPSGSIYIRNGQQYRKP